MLYHHYMLFFIFMLLFTYNKSFVNYTEILIIMIKLNVLVAIC